jgi:hypothetical protein
MFTNYYMYNPEEGVGYIVVKLIEADTLEL